LYNIKKLHQFIFSLQYEKQLNKRKGKKIQEGKKIKIFIKSKEKNKKNLNCFKRIFETQKQTCFNKKIQPNLK
jgi:hypothetical protein